MIVTRPGGPKEGEMLSEGCPYLCVKLLDSSFLSGGSAARTSGANNGVGVEVTWDVGWWWIRWWVWK